MGKHSKHLILEPAAFSAAARGGRTSGVHHHNLERVFHDMIILKNENQHNMRFFQPETTFGKQKRV